MTGRGRGRGALARWEASNKTSGEGSSRVGSSRVFPLSKENWEDEVRKSPQDSVKSNTVVRVTHIIDVEHFWAQTGKVFNNELYLLVTMCWNNEIKNNTRFTNRKLTIASPSNVP